jgi:tRNA(Arg) A34 adenosine deaminase TadA
MRLVIKLAQGNVDHGTGGPFGAAIFNYQTHQLLAPGVNRVVTTPCSVAHAEVLAIAIAEQMVGHFALGGEGMTSYELVTSTEPCAMCLGAVVWSGVRQIVCGARGEDAERAGFDEGPKPADWVHELERRDIKVLRDVCRAEAVEVFDAYQRAGGIIYNGRQSGS